jgi:hypothetical protein
MKPVALGKGAAPAAAARLNSRRARIPPPPPRAPLRAGISPHSFARPPCARACQHAAVPAELDISPTQALQLIRAVNEVGVAPCVTVVVMGDVW